MPRDSNGVYSLPGGNPVVTLTTITSTWANVTMDDLATALTGSLARDGAGGMTASLKLVNGTIGAPGLSWATEPTSGLYRSAAGDFRYSVASNDVVQIVAGALRTVAGTLAAPSHSFILDPDSGFYSQGANSIGVSAGNTDVALFGSARVQSTVAHWFADGNVGTPSLSFSSDTDTGIYRISANVLGFAVGGIAVAHATTVSFHVDVAQQLNEDGAVGTPSYSFENDPDTGVYRSAANTMELVANGALKLTVATTLTSRVTHAFADGAVGTPGLNFDNDPNTGIYRIGADNLGFSTGGVLRANINSTGQLLYNNIEVGYRGLGSNSQNAGYAFVAADVGRGVAAATAGAFTLNSGIFSTGDLITFYNTTGANCTLTQGAGVNIRLMGASGTTGNRTVADFGVCTIIAQNGTVFLAGGPGVS